MGSGWPVFVMVTEMTCTVQSSMVHPAPLPKGTEETLLPLLCGGEGLAS